ncbi:uncharacterized protein LOC144450599 [Glandiceps talaboti]
MESKYHVNPVDHYLDDYFTAGHPNTDQCNTNLQGMLLACHELGFPVNPNKVTSPSTIMEFLGITLDTENMEARVSQDRINEITEELHTWTQKTKASKREILSLIGKLSFITCVCRPGRTFLRRLIDTSKKLKHLHHKIRLTKAFKLDLQWWLDYLPTWNGVSMFYDSYWTNNVDLHLYTDASDIGYGCVYGKQTLNGKFTDEIPGYTPKTHSINWRELYAIVRAADTWGSNFAGYKILFHCDNSSVVAMIRSGSSRNEKCASLLRKLFYICARDSFLMNAVHIPGYKNTDALSRYM